MVKVSACCDIGCVRQNNEDRILVDEEQGLFVVCDGIGGHNAGEVASAIGCERMREEVQRGRSLLHACQRAHEEVRAKAQEDSACAGMGSTLIAVKMNKRKYEIVWVGDSRAYLVDLKKMNIVQLSQDHSFIAEKIAAGILSKEKGAGHPMEHVLTQSLGCKKVLLKPGQILGKLKKDQLLLLCSDGLYNECAEEEILALAAKSSFDNTADSLVKQAKMNGGKDNVSVILIGAQHVSIKDRFTSFKAVNT